MAETPPVRTTNGALQTQLEHWAAACATVAALPLGSAERMDGVLAFTRTFVPGDVTDDDIVYFSTNLSEDEEYFLSVKRDIEQCASGVNVESIKGNQKKKALYTLKPMDGTLSEGGSDLDLVKELCFKYNGSTGWRAEG